MHGRAFFACRLQVRFKGSAVVFNRFYQKLARTASATTCEIRLAQDHSSAIRTIERGA